MKGYKAYENNKNHCYTFSKIADFIYTRSVVGPLFYLMNSFGKVLVFYSFFKELPDGGHVKLPEGVVALRIGR
jgi:hypothetical protein